MEKLVTDGDGGNVIQGNQLLVDSNDIRQQYLVFLQEHNPDNVKDYLMAKDKEIFIGKHPVWKRSFGISDSNFDLFYRQNHFASIREIDGVIIADVKQNSTNTESAIYTFEEPTKEDNFINAVSFIERELYEIRAGEFFEQLHSYNKTSVDEYYNNVKNKIKSGDPVWFVRNVDTNIGYCYDFYSNRQYVGSVIYDGELFVDGVTGAPGSEDENYVVFKSDSLAVNLIQAIEYVESANN